jgi:hypothetical protein
MKAAGKTFGFMRFVITDFRSNRDRMRDMAKPSSNDPIEPMDLANMRQNGVRSLAVQCHQCLHEVIMNVDHLAGDVAVPSLGPMAELAGESEAMKRPAELIRTTGQAPARLH